MEGPSRSELVVAAFDVDGTLTRRDCVVPFLARVAGRRALLAASLRNPWLLLSTAAGRGNRDRLKELVVGRVVRDRAHADLEALGQQFAVEQIARWLRPDTVMRLRHHQRLGHRVVLVSASLGPYLHPLAHEVLGGIDAVLCTELEVDEVGRCTGRLVGSNCRGPEKRRRLSGWIDGRRAVIWAYGDSAGDEELLAMARHATRVGRRPIPDEPGKGPQR